MKLIGISPASKRCRVCGWYLKKSTLPGYNTMKLKKQSLLTVWWNGGAPNASMKNSTPSENISAGLGLQGISVAQCTSGAMYISVPILYFTSLLTGVENPKSQNFRDPISERRTFSSLISMCVRPAQLCRA